MLDGGQSGQAPRKYPARSQFLRIDPLLYLRAFVIARFHELFCRIRDVP